MRLRVNYRVGLNKIKNSIARLDFEFQPFEALFQHLSCDFKHFLLNLATVRLSP